MSTNAKTQWRVSYTCYDMNMIKARKHIAKNLLIIVLVIVMSMGIFSLDSKSMPTDTSTVDNLITTEYEHRTVNEEEVSVQSEVEVVLMDDLIMSKGISSEISTLTREEESTGKYLVLEETEEPDVYNVITAEVVSVPLADIDNTLTESPIPVIQVNTLTKEKEKPKTEKAKAVTVNQQDTEFQIFCRIVEAEVTGGAQSASYYGLTAEQFKACKRHVADVILNRVRNPKFGNTIEEVVFKTNQFEPVSTGRYYNVTVTDLTVQACTESLQGSDTTNGALYFRSDGKAFSGKTETIPEDEVGHRFFK